MNLDAGSHHRPRERGTHWRFRRPRLLTTPWRSWSFRCRFQKWRLGGRSRRWQSGSVMSDHDTKIESNTTTTFYFVPPFSFLAKSFPSVLLHASRHSCRSMVMVTCRAHRIRTLTSTQAPRLHHATSPLLPKPHPYPLPLIHIDSPDKWNGLRSKSSEVVIRPPRISLYRDITI